MGYALEREYVKGKSIVGGKDNFLIKMWALSYHTTLCKLKELLSSDILIPKSVVYIVVALIRPVARILLST
jgi:hypothetical protein